MVGSHHDWFEGRGPKCVLMVLIDDATSLTHAWFYPAETTDAAFDLFGRWADHHGLPRAVYVDRHSIYRDEDHPQKPTQMRLRGIHRIDQANDLLEKVFLKDLNQRYAIKAANGVDLHREVKQDLKQVLCVIEPRVVGQDWCVRWKNRWLQIDACHAHLRLPRKKVTVKQLADGELVCDYQSQPLTAVEVDRKPERKTKPKVVINNRRWKPAATHPWREPSVARSTVVAFAAPHGGRQTHKQKQWTG